MTIIKIQLDSSAEKVALFKSIDSISLNKMELFKYAVMMLETPKTIVESDFDYLQSKIPALELMFSEFIVFTKNSIKSLSTDDRNKKLISELVGVGVGLKYTVELLNTNPNKFKKIAPSTEGKYLDYSTIHEGKEYEIETKGTTQTSFSSFKTDVLAKKEDSKKRKVHLRFGTITMIKNADDNGESKCVIVDDPPEDIITNENDIFKTQLLNYAVFLSYIIDSKYYNKYIRPLRAGKIRKIRIDENKFFTKYNHLGKDYYGECFDLRLNKENIINTFSETNNPKEYFNKITNQVGKIKIFIGLSVDIINAINEKNIDFLNNFNNEVDIVDKNNESIFLDKDGILIVKSKEGANEQLEKIFTEEEVFKRLGLYKSYVSGNPHTCGAPCRSKELLGKPCEIKTYRSHCHYHR